MLMLFCEKFRMEIKFARFVNKIESLPAQDSNLVFAHECVAVHPRVVLIVQLSAVFALAKEYLSASWVHLSILGHIVDLALVDGPAVVIFVVLLHFFCSVVDRVRVLYHLAHPRILLNEFLKRPKSNNIRVKFTTGKEKRREILSDLRLVSGHLVLALWLVGCSFLPLWLLGQCSCVEHGVIGQCQTR